MLFGKDKAGQASAAAQVENSAGNGKLVWKSPRECSRMCNVVGERRWANRANPLCLCKHVEEFRTDAWKRG
jgi:hypothetical protein